MFSEPAAVESHAAAKSYATSWRVAGDTYTQLATSYPDLGDPAVHLSSRSLVAQAVPGGHVVFVANGRDGVLYRDVAGVWRRLGIPMGGEGLYFELPPRLASDPKPVDPAVYVAAVVGALILLAAGIAAAIRRSLRPSRVLIVLLIATSAGCVAALGVHVPDVGMFPGILYGAVIIGSALAFGARLAVVCRPGQSTIVIA